MTQQMQCLCGDTRGRISPPQCTRTLSGKWQMQCLCGETQSRITAHRSSHTHSVANYFKRQTGLQCPFLDTCPRLGSHIQISGCEWGPSGLILPYRCFLLAAQSCQFCSHEGLKPCIILRCTRVCGTLLPTVATSPFWLIYLITAGLLSLWFLLSVFQTRVRRTHSELLVIIL